MKEVFYLHKGEYKVMTCRLTDALAHEDSWCRDCQWVRVLHETVLREIHEMCSASHFFYPVWLLCYVGIKFSHVARAFSVMLLKPAVEKLVDSTPIIYLGNMSSLIGIPMF